MSIDHGVSGGNGGSGNIGFTATGLKTAADNFATIAAIADTNGTIDKILEAIDAINGCWTGEQHTNSQTDFELAKTNLSDAKKTINSMRDAAAKLAANASAATYG